MNAQLILNLLAQAKTTRYGLVFLSGIMFGGWLLVEYPEIFKQFVPNPGTPLVAFLVGLWLSNAKTEWWKEEVQKAKEEPPPGKTICGCEPGDPL